MRPASLLPASRPPLKQIVIASAVIFLVAFGVRFLSWHDTRMEVWKVQTVVAADYQRTGKVIRQLGFRGFYDASGPLADPNLLGHPPGYPIAQAFLGALFGESTDAIRFFQITCDALAAVLIFLIAIELLPFAAGVIAGLLVAFSPQFAWNSVLLLPDTLAILPLLMAVYCLTRAVKKPRFVTVMAAGVLVGVSCWLRANALLMAPFLALLAPLLFQRGQRLRYAGALLAGALLIIAPLTIRNWIVFHHFIPVSLGAGQTMLEGISDYDPDRRFGIPNTDMGIMKMEAEQHNRPDYYSTLFAPDGIKRDRMRLARGFSVIRDNPAWFATVMIRRAGSMLRLERARLISVGPPVTHKFTNVGESQQVWTAKPTDLMAQVAGKSPGAEVSLSSDSNLLSIVSDETKYGPQFSTAPVAIQPYHDYVFKFPVVVENGRMTISVVGTPGGKDYSSVIVEKAEVKEGQPQPTNTIDLPFVSGADEFVSLAFNNTAPESGRSIVNVAGIELFDLGPAAFLWARYPRLLVRATQRLFITAIMLPLALIGIVVLARRRAWQTLALLLGVPAYYLCVQSMLHTEYRYVLAVHYFLFVLVALALHEIWSIVVRNIRNRTRRRSNTSETQLAAQ
jgi:hypothetical protein